MALAPEPGQLPAWMGSPVILALSLAAQVTGEVHLEASAGAEIDTNARRAVSRGEDDPAVVTDASARLSTPLTQGGMIGQIRDVLRGGEAMNVAAAVAEAPAGAEAG